MKKNSIELIDDVIHIAAGLFLNRQSWGHDDRHHNFAVIAPVIMKFVTGMKLDAFYTMVAKRFKTSLLLRNYDVITCMLADR